MLDDTDNTGTPDNDPRDAQAPEGGGAPDQPETLPGTDLDTGPAEASGPPAPAKKTARKTTKKAAKKSPAKKTTKKAAAKAEPMDPPETSEPAQPTDGAGSAEAAGTAEPSELSASPAKKTAKKAAPRKRSTKKKAEAAPESATVPADDADADAATDAAEPVAPAATALLFQAPETTQAPRGADAASTAEDEADADTDTGTGEDGSGETGADDESGEASPGTRRRRRRGGRRRRKSGAGDDNGAEGADGDGSDDTSGQDDQQDQDTSKGQAGQSGRKAQQGDAKGGSGGDADDEKAEGGSSRRRRRRRRAGEEGDAAPDDPANTVTRVRKARSAEDEITSVSGSTRLEAKKQRRREGREAGRRRAPIVSEAEFLARREAVDRVMVVRQRDDLTQIAVLEDKVLVEHYVARESQTSLIGNVYLGRVQNVLPSMEAAFVDIGKGRNAVLYAGEVNWDALGAGNGPRKIEQVLKSGQPILVQVTKDPIGHKGARLTSQVSLPGRFLVYVPDGTTSGISRKLPDTERTRLKTLLKEIVPDSAGVIVRTAAEGASEEELTRDVERLTARWNDIEAKVEKGNAPQLLYGEPDLTLKVVRDLFTEDFGKLVVSGDDAWDMVESYVKHVAPDLADRLEKHDTSGGDVFAAYRIDEQIAKALDRKVWLPSGGSLIIDRTEAMTVVDVNTGKFTGSGGNLEETVTKNNLEAAEEIVRQLRLRDIGGIIVVDFIDMVLESNRDLVLRRLVECLGRDRTRHQVAEVTSLGLVQMTRKRIGTGLLEAFSESCDHCQGRGLLVHHEPVEPKKKQEEEPRRGRRGRSRGKGGDDSGNQSGEGSNAGNGGSGSNGNRAPSPKDVAAMAHHRPAEPTDEPRPEADGRPEETSAEQPGPTEAPADVAPDTPVGTPVEAPAESRAESAGETPTEPAGADADEPANEPAEEPVEEPAAAGPVVVTSSRRRVARRPAGPPSGALSTAEAQEPDLDLVPTDSPDASSPEGVAPVEESHDRADGSDGADADEADHDAHPTVHVPVKKRGRKR